MTRKRRLVSLAISLAMLVGILAQALPAHAAPKKGTASVDLKNVIAGTQQVLLFSVTNGGAAGTGGVLPGDPTINYVRIGTDTPEAFTISNGGAAGWTFDIDSQGQRSGAGRGPRWRLAR
jgi:hypothetical protein